MKKNEYTELHFQNSHQKFAVLRIHFSPNNSTWRQVEKLPYFAILFPTSQEKTTQSCWCHYWCVKLCINAGALQTSASANRWTCLLVGCCRAEWSKMKMNNKWEQRSKKRNDEGCNRNDSSWRSERRNELELSRNNMDTRENAENNQKWIKHRESKEEKL